MIHGIVERQRLRLESDKVVADTIDYITAKFCFVGWDGYTKVVHFRQGETVYDIILTEDKILESDHLNLSQGMWEVYLHGNKDGQRVTTDVQTLRVYRTGALNGEPLPEIPLSIAEQILNKAANAEQTAQSVREDADAGKFNGKDYDHSAEFQQLAEEMASYGEQVRQDRDAIHAAVGTAQQAASDAGDFAEAAGLSAEQAKQVASKNGYFYFNIAENGHLMETKTDNVSDDLTFRLNAGRLEVTYE